jgi:hypothetical protein
MPKALGYQYLSLPLALLDTTDGLASLHGGDMRSQTL